MTPVTHQSAGLAGAVHTPSPAAPVYTQGPRGVNRGGGRVGLGGGGQCLTARSCELREEGSGLSGEGGAAPCLLRELRAVLRAQCICAWERLVFTESWELEAVPAPEIGPLLVQLMSPGCVGSPHCGGVITSCAPSLVCFSQTWRVSWGTSWRLCFQVQGPLRKWGRSSGAWNYSNPPPRPVWFSVLAAAMLSPRPEFSRIIPFLQTFCVTAATDTAELLPVAI